MKVTSKETLSGLHENIYTGEQENFDFDRYDIEVNNPFATKEYSVIVDFLNSEISGECIAYGSWFDIEIDECIELLKFVEKENMIIRDFTIILNQYKD